jgi:hypothetical protein
MTGSEPKEGSARFLAALDLDSWTYVLPPCSRTLPYLTSLVTQLNVEGDLGPGGVVGVLHVREDQS